MVEWPESKVSVCESGEPTGPAPSRPVHLSTSSGRVMPPGAKTGRSAAPAAPSSAASETGPPPPPPRKLAARQLLQPEHAEFQYAEAASVEKQEG